MMTHDDEIRETCRRISELLHGFSSAEDWAKTFDRLSQQSAQGPELRYRVRRLFGGMGSFNDLVLSRDGKPLIEENDRLNNLRAQLWELMQQQRTEPSS